MNVFYNCHKLMELSGWGQYPKIDAHVDHLFSVEKCHTLLKKGTVIARGRGRSYGDSSLAPHVLDTRYLNHFVSFDESKGILKCTSGVMLHDIIHHFVPRGWFLAVTPGTSFVSVGGAIASDVHGKNHHHHGTFTDHIVDMELLLGNGEQVVTSRTQLPELFHATCGGMGLTGVILSATLILKPIKSSRIQETTIKAADLDAVLSAFEEHHNATYSVAWIDCLARGAHLGRSLLMLGEHAEHGDYHLNKKKPLNIPFNLPGLINKASTRAFNSIYYAKKPSKRTQAVALERFFYPLDSLHNWNRLYGKSGLVQYQFVLPFSSGKKGLKEILEVIATSGSGSFLAVLKVLGKENENYLSFPLEGYTLAIDFKVSPTVLELLHRLDALVLNHGGRLYLTKDARMSAATFKEGYPQWEAFEEVRARYHAIGKFASMQSQRLGLL